MLRALLLDLGDTLVHDKTVLEHVPDALDVLKAMKIPMALVSDYTMPSKPSDVAPLFSEYVALVKKFGLLDYFEPADKHVTLSTQAGVTKPDRKIFELALERLGLPVDLSTAMFITENEDHVTAARGYGMTAWQFGGDFDDWTRGPLLVASALGTIDLGAVNLRLKALFQKTLVGFDGSTGTLADGSHVTLEIEDGEITSMKGATDAAFRKGLEDNAQLAPEGEAVGPGQTHAVEDGEVRRKRFSLK